MTTMTTNIPMKYRRYGEFLPNFEILVNETLVRRLEGSCNLEQIVGNPLDSEAFQALLNAGLIIHEGLVSLEDYPFETVVLEDYPIDVFGVINNIDSLLQSKQKEDSAVDTYKLAFEETHAIFTEVYDFVEWIQHSNCFTKNPSLVISVDENEKVKVSLK